MKPHVMVEVMKNRKQILAGAVLLGAGVVIGLGLGGLMNKRAFAVEAAPASAHVLGKADVKSAERVGRGEVDVPADKNESPPAAVELKGVSAEDLEIIRKIAAQRGETKLPPQEWVDHVWPKIKKSQAAKSQAVR